jgi:hypothetical protein
MIKKLFLLFILSLPIFSFGQMEIKGNVQDTTSGKSVPLKNALAMLVRIKDSVLVDFQRTNDAGNFNFKNLKIDTFQLIVSHPKFSDNSYYIFGSKENNDFDIKRIILPPKSQTIKEVVIYAYKDPIYYKGDTLVYIADSFKTSPNAVVEDLLKKLPGIKVNADGSLQAQGKDIQQVLVDGDEFFGADPTMATRNLGAQGIQTVEVYEKKDENSTDDTETIQVLDLRLKDSAKKGYFGKISGASDFGATNGNPFYEGEILANKFNKTQKISVFTLASNTMKSSLEWRDMYKYGLSSGNRGYNEEEDSWDWGSNTSQGNGIPRTLKSGVYFNDQITKKTELNVNYTYSNSGLKTSERSRSQYFLTDTSYVTDLINETEDKSENHEFNLKLTTKLDSLTTLEIEPKLRLNKLNTNSTDNTDFLFEDLALSRRTNVVNENDAKGTDFSTRVGLRRDFKKKGRKLTARYYFTLTDNHSNGNLNILDSSYVGTGFKTLTDQSKENNSVSNSHTANINYLEPIGKHVKIGLDYEFYNNFNEQSRFTRNLVNGVYSDLVADFSNNFENLKTQNRFGTEVIYEFKKHRFSTGLRYRDVQIENKNLFIDSSIFQSVQNFLPRAKYVYKISQHNRFTINYNTSSNQPSISQLQPVQDNTNPNRLVEGNPDLRPDFTHRFSLSYNAYKPLSGVYLWSGVNHNITDNAFGSSVEYDKFGRIRTKTVNVNGNTNSSLYGGVGFPLFKRFLEVNPSINLSNNKYTSLINGLENITTNANFTGNLELTVERDSLEFSVGGYYNYTSPKSSISTQAVNPYSSQGFNSALAFKFKHGLFFETDADYTINANRAAGYDINFLIWNASFTKSFLKNENLLVALEVNDILNQNTSANRYVNANVITDTQTSIIARYFMARVTYKFNSTKVKEQDDFF